MDEKKIYELIKNSAKEIETPESLKPEKMEKKLKEHKKADAGRRWKKYAVRTVEAAAVLALVFVAGRQTGLRQAGIQVMPENMMAADAVSETQTLSEQLAAETENVVSKESEAQEPAKKTLRVQTQETEEDAAQAQPEAADEEAAQIQPEAADEEAAQIQPEAAGEEATQSQSDTLRTFADSGQLYEKLYDYVNTQENRALLQPKNSTALVYEEAEMIAVDSADSATVYDAGSAAGYSVTNLRDASVDEGDIVKTDGEYIYIMKNNSSVQVIDVREAKMEKIAVIEPELLQEYVRDLYVDGNTMILVTTGSESELTETEPDCYETTYYNYTKVLTYDISDRKTPVLIGSVQQEGRYHSSRKNGKYVYAFTTFAPQIADTEEDSVIMPRINKTYLEAADIYVPERISSTQYLVIGAVDTENPQELCEHKAVVSGADQFYVSGESIYILFENWEASATGGTATEIAKFSYENGSLKGAGSCLVEGYLNDSFSIDEYEGNLRLVTTNWAGGEEINALYVFDENLKLTGKIEDIAAGETIRSARFMGDVGYFVTFRQTDPLFSVDLSDPEAPAIIGELKVTGFSEYLHFYGEDKLLGIGYEADEETGVTTGIKLSMFDISDPGNVTESKRYVIKDAYYCPGLNNYKAIMIDPQKNLFGFVCGEDYLVFRYDEEKGFENLLAYHLNQNTDSAYGYGYYGAENVRGLYIGDTFYLAQNDVLRAFDMESDFAQTDKTEF